MRLAARGALVTLEDNIDAPFRPPLSGAPEIWLLSERIKAFDRSNRTTTANATQAMTRLSGQPADESV
jgi:hypothetical protein